MAEGTWVGLEVHARKVVAGVLDTGSGELRSWRAPAVIAETVAWLKQYPARNNGGGPALEAEGELAAYAHVDQDAVAQNVPSEKSVDV